MDFARKQGVEGVKEEQKAVIKFQDKKFEENQEICVKGMVGKSNIKEDEKNEFVKNSKQASDKQSEIVKSVKKSTSIISEGPKFCIHSVSLIDYCQDCAEAQRSISITKENIPEEKETKPEEKQKMKVPITEEDKKDETMQNKTNNKTEDIKTSPTSKSTSIKPKGPQICVHDIPIADFCKSCSEMEIVGPTPLNETETKEKELMKKEDKNALASKDAFH